MASIITLLTDFGQKDWYVSSLKGVILGISPGSTVIDITHEIPPGDVFAGALVLREANRYFPGGTIHVAVVDPGVGTSRRAIAAKTEKYIFVGPDNGLLSLALEGARAVEVRLIEREDLFLKPVSRTFHGRDIFAPVAGHLAKGGDFRMVGRCLNDWVRLSLPELKRGPGFVQGTVVYVDRFGNGITNIAQEELFQIGPPESLKVELGGGLTIPGVKYTYGEVPEGWPVAYIGSSGKLEIGVNAGNARDALGLLPGVTVVRVVKG